MESKPRVDALTIALDAISDRWSLHVVRVIALGAFRFTDIVEATGAPRDVLTLRLRKLVEAGTVEKVPYGATGSRSGYRLTEKGRDLAQVLLVLKRWGDTWRPDGVAPLEYTHTRCGHPFVAEIVCQACQHEPAAGEIQTTQDPVDDRSDFVRTDRRSNDLAGPGREVDLSDSRPGARHDVVRVVRRGE